MQILIESKPKFNDCIISYNSNISGVVFNESDLLKSLLLYWIPKVPIYIES